MNVDYNMEDGSVAQEGSQVQNAGKKVELQATEDLESHTDPQHWSQRRESILYARGQRKGRCHSVLSQELKLLNKLKIQAEEEREGAGVVAETRPPDEQDEKSPEGEKSGGEHNQLLHSHASQKLAESTKLEDQINLQHLIELMEIFHVRLWVVTCY